MNFTIFFATLTNCNLFEILYKLSSKLIPVASQKRSLTFTYLTLKESMYEYLLALTVYLDVFQKNS